MPDSAPSDDRDLVTFLCDDLRTKFQHEVPSVLRSVRFDAQQRAIPTLKHLGDLGDPQAIPAVVDVIRRHRPDGLAQLGLDVDPQVLGLAIVTLAQLGGAGEHHGPLVRALTVGKHHRAVLDAAVARLAVIAQAQPVPAGFDRVLLDAAEALDATAHQPLLDALQHYPPSERSTRLAAAALDLVASCLAKGSKPTPEIDDAAAYACALLQDRIHLGTAVAIATARTGSSWLRRTAAKALAAALDDPKVRAQARSTAPAIDWAAALHRQAGKEHKLERTSFWHASLHLDPSMKNILQTLASVLPLDWDDTATAEILQMVGVLDGRGAAMDLARALCEPASRLPAATRSLPDDTRRRLATIASRQARRAIRELGLLPFAATFDTPDAVEQERYRARAPHHRRAEHAMAALEGCDDRPATDDHFAIVQACATSGDPNLARIAADALGARRGDERDLRCLATLIDDLALTGPDFDHARSAAAWAVNHHTEDRLLATLRQWDDTRLQYPLRFGVLAAQHWADGTHDRGAIVRSARARSVAAKVLRERGTDPVPVILQDLLEPQGYLYAPEPRESVELLADLGADHALEVVATSPGLSMSTRVYAAGTAIRSRSRLARAEEAMGDRLWSVLVLGDDPLVDSAETTPSPVARPARATDHDAAEHPDAPLGGSADEAQPRGAVRREPPQRRPASAFGRFVRKARRRSSAPDAVPPAAGPSSGSTEPLGKDRPSARGPRPPQDPRRNPGTGL